MRLLKIVDDGFSLASTYRNQGRWKEAEELQVKAIETRNTVLGAEHPSTVNSMNSLACTWKAQGKHTEALDMVGKCIEAL